LFLFYLQEKFVKKFMRVKENIKINKSLCIDFGDIFFELANLISGTSNFDLTHLIKFSIHHPKSKIQNP